MSASTTPSITPSITCTGVSFSRPDGRPVISGLDLTVPTWRPVAGPASVWVCDQTLGR
jgi:hypothetical protein